MGAVCRYRISRDAPGSDAELFLYHLFSSGETKNRAAVQSPHRQQARLKTESYFRKDLVIVPEFSVEPVPVAVKQMAPQSNVYLDRKSVV